MNARKRASIARQIELRGVRVHNLKNVDLSLPLNRLIVMTGVSGSGKSSLAFDTLFVEGQRRYIESFSTYARQFFDQMEKPDADQIVNIPPAIAIRQSALSKSGRSTVGTQTEILDHLRILFARLGEPYCPNCEVPVRRDTLQNCIEQLAELPDGTRYQLAFPLKATAGWQELLRASGFQRFIDGAQTRTLESDDIPAESSEVAVVVDRLVAGKTDRSRLADSLELASRGGRGRWQIIVAGSADEFDQLFDQAEISTREIDSREWTLCSFDSGRNCSRCGLDLPPLDPRLFSFTSPLGACPECNGYGSRPSISWHRIVPDSSKSLEDGAIAPWNAPSYQHELEELLELADDYGVSTDVPFRDLPVEALEVIMEGVPERRFGGLVGFFAWLERKKYRMGIRAFLSRWRSYETCAACDGARLQPVGRAVRLIEYTFEQLCRASLVAVRDFCARIRAESPPGDLLVADLPLTEIEARLDFLHLAGLDYLTLDRTVRTLSGGEAQRVALTSALGSKLVNSLFVLDEPSAGLHPIDTQRILDAVKLLRDRKNTVLVVEHEAAFIRDADWIVDFGPGAGRDGGNVVYSGDAEGLRNCDASQTAKYYVSGKEAVAANLEEADREPRRPSGWIRIEGIRRHNLDGIDVRIPLGVLCVVTGVSGSGKSTLIDETLYSAAARGLGEQVVLDEAEWWQHIDGLDAVEDVQLVDQKPLGRSSRSNPVTYVKAFDEIRKLFASTEEARLRNFTPSSFSFNSSTGGRCQRCEGQGQVSVDLHFLGDLSMTCPDCHGTRYEPEILAVKYRGLTIAEVLSKTVAEAFALFRTEGRLLRRLQVLKDVGLDYLPLGQSTSTLSGGEVQRLKLAGQLSGLKQKSRLLLLDEPTIGLHRADIVKLVNCLRRLVDVGYSVVVIEHDLDLVGAADYLIEMGPGAGSEGGRIVAEGTLDEVAGDQTSITARSLALMAGI